MPLFGSDIKSSTLQMSFRPLSPQTNVFETIVFQAGEVGFFTTLMVVSSGLNFNNIKDSILTNPMYLVCVGFYFCVNFLVNSF